MVEGDTVQAYRNFYKVAKGDLQHGKTDRYRLGSMTQNQNDTMIGCSGNLDKEYIQMTEQDDPTG